MAVEGGVVIKQEVMFSDNNNIDHENHAVGINGEDVIFIKPEIENQDDNMEFLDDFAPVKEEMSREMDEIFDTHDEKLDMKCTVELHKGDFYGTSSCRKCRKIKGIEETLFRCKTKKCLNLKFQYKVALINHKIDKHGDWPSRCQICNVRLWKKSYFKTHIASAHFGYKPYACNICPKTYFTKEKMVTHVTQHAELENVDNWTNYVTKGNVQKSLELGEYVKTICEVCDEEFFSESDLKEHMNYHNPCHICGEIFGSTTLRRQHLTLHRKIDQFEKNKQSCPVCSKRFNSLKEYDKHCLSNFLVCCICNLKFSNIQLKKTHMDSTHPKEPLSCQILGKELLFKKSLKMHEKSHSLVNKGKKNQSSASSKDSEVVKPFMCEICGKSFGLGRSLKKHQRIHDTSRPNIVNSYTCNICKEKFPTRSLRQEHYISSHSQPINLENAKIAGDSRKSTPSAKNSKGFKCHLCDKSFADKDSLASHSYIHNGMSSFLCNICDKEYATKCSLGLHMKKKHNHVPRVLKRECLKCDICNKLIFKQHMRAHKSKHEVKNVMCSVCKVTFEDEVYLNDHAKEKHGGRKYGCSLCDMAFATSIELDGHINWHNEVTPYQCEYCNRSFASYGTLKSHSLIIHFVKIELRCKFCDFKFRELRLFNSHMKTVHGKKAFSNCDRKKIFQCDICAEKFFRKDLLERHLFSVHFKNSQSQEPQSKDSKINKPAFVAKPVKLKDYFKATYQCYICKENYNYKYLLKKHLFCTHWQNLSKYQKNLMWLAKEKAYQKNYKSVWLNENNIIFARKNDNEKVIKISNYRDVDNM